MKEITIRCQSCQGTGLYRGMAERDNCATVCHTCKGTGKTTFKYTEFTGLKKMDNINRIFGNTCGYVHSDKDTKDIKFSEGGCTYAEWHEGQKPKPVKSLYCPYLWTNQDVGDELKDQCNKNIARSRITDCVFYKFNKSSCWKTFEEE